MVSSAHIPNQASFNPQGALLKTIKMFSVQYDAPNPNLKVGENEILCFRCPCTRAGKSLDLHLRSDVYMAQPYMETAHMLDRDLKRGSTEMLIMAMVEDRPRHGYEIGKLIEQRSQGVLQFHVASLYPLLYRLEKRGLIKGRWVEKTGERRRRFYTLTPAGRQMLAEQRRMWKDFFAALDLVAGINPA